MQLYAPADELDVTAMKRVELAYVIEDDFGVASAELVWETGRERGRRPVPITAPGASGRAQGKLVWDLAEVPLPPGAEITYHLEAKDTDSVRGPNVGVSRAYKLRVWSPRQRHEQSTCTRPAVRIHSSCSCTPASTSSGSPPGRSIRR